MSDRLAAVSKPRKSREKEQRTKGEVWTKRRSVSEARETENLCKGSAKKEPLADDAGGLFLFMYALDEVHCVHLTHRAHTREIIAKCDTVISNEGQTNFVQI